MSTDQQVDGQAPRLRALRGAITAERDAPDAVVSATEELLTELLERNAVAPDDIVSIVFTATADLTSEFPAAAARRLGLDDVPLLCAQEIPVPGSVPRCIRVLVHLYSALGRKDLKHVYLRGASQLRTDLSNGEG